MKEKELPEFHVQISHPDKKYRIEFIPDNIKTLEGVSAGLPFGGTSGIWGDSGSGWTEQKGTPIGADIIYFSVYEQQIIFRLVLGVIVLLIQTSII